MKADERGACAKLGKYSLVENIHGRTTWETFVEENYDES
jgi:hypothetical protein